MDRIANQLKTEYGANTEWTHLCMLAEAIVNNNPLVQTINATIIHKAYPSLLDKLSQSYEIGSLSMIDITKLVRERNFPGPKEFLTSSFKDQYELMHELKMKHLEEESAVNRKLLLEDHEKKQKTVSIKTQRKKRNDQKIKAEESKKEKLVQRDLMVKKEVTEEVCKVVNRTGLENVEKIKVPSWKGQQTEEKKELSSAEINNYIEKLEALSSMMEDEKARKFLQDLKNHFSKIDDGENRREKYIKERTRLEELLKTEREMNERAREKLEERHALSFKEGEWEREQTAKQFQILEEKEKLKIAQNETTQSMDQMLESAHSLRQASGLFFDHLRCPYDCTHCQQLANTNN